MTKVFISNNAKQLRKAIKGKTSITVEAEFGDEIVEGTIATLAHHGKNKGKVCPCLYSNFEEKPQVIGVSHFDLDTLGGVLAALGRKPKNNPFWALAAFVDEQGVHKLNGDELEIEKLYAFYSWSRNNRLFATKEALEISKFIKNAENILNRILENEEKLILNGKQYRDDQVNLERESFIRSKKSVCLRISEHFVNHLYGKEFNSIVAFNPKTGSITVSFSEPQTFLKCNSLVQEMWGPLAGGHETIAGSPRDRKMKFEDAEKMFHYIARFI